MVQMVAHHNATPEGWAAYQALYPRPLNRQTNSGRAMLDGRVAITEDIEADSARSAATRDAARLMGLRSAVTVPLLHKERTIGALTVGRDEPGTFSPKQVALLQTFADQAVIAIENVRLFNETKEALERQTATSEILRVIASSPTDVQPVFDAIARQAMRLCSASYGVVTRYDGELLYLVAHAHVRPEGVEAMKRVFPMLPSRATTSSRAILERAVVHVPDALIEPDYDQSVSVGLQNRSVLAVAMLRSGEPIGTISVGRFEPQPFTETQIALLQTFADQAVIAIENVRLFNETKEALEQQTATADILRVISSSPADVQPVFNVIAENAARLCEAFDANIFSRDGDRLLLVAHWGSIPTLGPVGEATHPLVRGTTAGRAMLDAQAVHVVDIQTEVDEFPESSTLGRQLGIHTLLSVPLMRESAALGAITLRRTESRLFTDQQVALLQTFADQAVIAIENVRLFTELQEKNRALTRAHAQVSEALEQQTATSEILRVISSSPTDAQPVFESIAKSAMELCDAQFSAVFRFDGRLLHLAAHSGWSPAGVDALRREFPIVPHRRSAGGRAILSSAVEHIPDVHADAEYALGAVGDIVISTVAVPMLREGVVIGTINVNRFEPGPFSDRQIELLKTCADQAVIAIENVRLFKELEAKNRDLTEALDQQ